MKPIKAWAVVMDSGRIREMEGLCVFQTKPLAERYSDGWKIVRVEIREAPTTKKRGAK